MPPALLEQPGGVAPKGLSFRCKTSLFTETLIPA